MISNTNPIRWHNVTIPTCFTSNGKPLRSRLCLRLANQADRKRWEFTLDAFKSPKMLRVYCFVATWSDPPDAIPLPRTHAIAAKFCGNRERMSDNFGPDFVMYHANGFAVLQTLLDELAGHMTQPQPYDAAMGKISEIERLILEAVANNPGANQKQIQEAIHRKRAFKDAQRNLLKCGYIEIERGRCGALHHYIAEGNQ